MFHISIWEDWCSVWGAKPTKAPPPRDDGTGLSLLVLFAKNVFGAYGDINTNYLVLRDTNSTQTLFVERQFYATN